jgi:murein DD-endopeptidase MepM/ murein hydrolase activator NlpD
MKFLFTIILIFSFSCASKPAKIVNRSKVVYDKNNSLNKEKYSENNKKKINNKIQGNLSEKPKQQEEVKAIKTTEIEVESGETLYSIAKKHQVTVRDLIKQNKLNPPYALKKGEKLIIPSPNYHEVKAGETLYGISRLYNMKVNQLIEINELKEPYSVSVGQKIRVENLKESDNIKVVDNSSNQEQQGLNKKSDEGFIERNLDRSNHFSWPLRGEIISKFGPKSSGLYNDGINIKASEGSSVNAAEEGVVAYVGNELKGYGNLVIVKHGGGWITAYAHLKDFTVKRGQKVEKGLKIGSVGATGNVNFPQLYFGLRKGRDAVNPQNYLK